MIIFLDKEQAFPDPSLAPEHGLVAVGGDLSEKRLLQAYNMGIFPWYNEEDPICWHSPDPRMVFVLEEEQPMKISKSLRQSKRNRGYTIKTNTCFEDVIERCASVPRKEEKSSSWLNKDLIKAYTSLHYKGHAKSIEVFKEDTLVGGLYGVDLPGKGIFCGESMFSIATDASKIALWYLIDDLKFKNYRLLDAQVYNDHLASLGAFSMDRQVFLSYLRE